jgi:hypothetical protein
MFKDKQTPLNLDQEKERRCTHVARPLIPDGEAIIIPTIRTEIPSLILESLLE